MAKEIIKENHPLNDTDLHVVFPIFSPFKSCLEKKQQDEVAQSKEE